MLAHQVVLLTSTKSSRLTQLPSCQHLAPITPLNATLVNFAASVDYKRLTVRLNPLDATLTQNRGWGPLAVGGNSRNADTRDVAGNDREFGVSVRSQRLHDVNARGTCRRQRRCNHRSRKQDDRRADYRHGAGHADVQEIAARKAGQEIPAGCPCDHSSHSHDGAFDDHSRKQTLRRRTESEADAELARA